MYEWLLDKLNECKGYEIAFMTTFNFDVEFFERSVLSILYSNEIKNVSVFVDSEELSKAFSRVEFTSMGQKYVVNPIRIKSSFHPKLILLLGPAGAAMFVASANLTVSGYYQNNEIFNYYVLDENHPENIGLIYDAYQFFKSINNLSYGLDEVLFEKANNYKYLQKKPEPSQECRLIHNFETPIINQLQDFIEDVKYIDIAVPYYDNVLSALKEIQMIFPKAIVRTYIQNNSCRVHLDKLMDILPEEQVIGFTGFYGGSKSFYHGKVIRFVTADESYILYGSANCTKAALLETHELGGNVECDILEKGSANEFDYFFDMFEKDDRELSCVPLEYSTEKKNNNYFFKYGILKDVLTLYVGYEKYPDIQSIELENDSLKWRIQDDEIIITLEPESWLSEKILTLTIKADSTETVNCWFINPEILEINRNREKIGTIYNVNLDSTDRFIEDRKAIIEAFCLGASEYKKMIDVYRIVEQEEEPDGEELEEGIINYIVPPANIIEEYNKYEYAKKLMPLFVERFLRLNYCGTNDVEKKTKTSTETVVNSASRKATTDEIAFSRFVKTRVRNMTDEYAQMLAYDHYLARVNVLIDIFDYYTIREKVDGMFDFEYVVDTKYRLIEQLLKKNYEEDNQDIITETIILVLQNALENQYILKNHVDTNRMISYDFEKVLDIIDDKYDIRESYQQFLPSIVERINFLKNNAIDVQSAERYIENLFSYKPKERVFQIISSDYGNCDFTENENSLQVITSTTNPSSCFRLRENSAREVRKLHKKTGWPKELIISIDNNKIYGKPTLDPISIIEFTIDFEKNIVKRTLLRESGNIIKEYIR